MICSSCKTRSSLFCTYKVSFWINFIQRSRVFADDDIKTNPGGAACMVNNDMSHWTLEQRGWWFYWEKGALCESQPTPYIQMNLIQMQYLKHRSAEPQHLPLIPSHWISSTKFTWWHYYPKIQLTTPCKRSSIYILDRSGSVINKRNK